KAKSSRMVGAWMIPTAWPRQEMSDRMSRSASNRDRDDKFSGQGKTFFGHPRGLATLFFTEMWERFSYYGMRALLILFMTDTTRGGMGWGVEHSSAVYGLYTFSVYVLSLPGGWIADRLIGKKKAVLWGGIVIALGHYTLAVPSVFTY